MFVLRLLSKDRSMGHKCHEERDKDLKVQHGSKEKNPGGGNIFCTPPERPWGPPRLLYNGYRVTPGVKRPQCGVDIHPHLAPKLNKEKPYPYSASWPLWIVIGWNLPLFTLPILLYGGMWWRSWLRHCAPSQKVAASIPYCVIRIFHWRNPSDHIMALGSIQSLTEMRTSNISWGVKAAGAYGWQPYHLNVPTVLKSGSLKLLEH
jgi:hypothetical protein